MSSTGDLLRDLQAAHPVIGDIVRVHLSDNGEVLPHLLMADITRWLIVTGPEPAVLRTIEHHRSVGDERVQDVIAVSFVENMIGEEAAVRWHLGPQLAADLRRMEEWHPGPDAPPT